MFNKTVKTVIFSRKVGGAPLRATIFILQHGLMVYFNTNKTQSFFFLQNTNCIKTSQVIFGGGGGAGGGGPPCSLPLDLPLAHSAN